MKSAPIFAKCSYRLPRQSVVEKVANEQNYVDLDDLIADVKAWIASRNSDIFGHGIDRLTSKCVAVLQVDCDYNLE